MLAGLLQFGSFDRSRGSLVFSISVDSPSPGPVLLLLGATCGIHGNGSGCCAVGHFTATARKHVERELELYARRV
jgi:hypothetical protein